jgi:hypothetical protein
MHVQRALVAKALAEAPDHMVRALNGIDRFAATRDALVRVDFDEHASADVAALHIGDSQGRRAGGLLRVVDGLSKCRKRPRGGRAGHRAGGQERTATGARLLHSASYLISKM